MLVDKSLIELRGIAQSFDIPDLFEKDKLQLIQAIEIKQKKLIPEPKINIPRPEYDARLMTKPPSKRSSQQEIEQMLTPFVARGLVLSFTDEQWHMKRGKKADEGTLRMPLKIVLRCAEKVME